MSEVYYRSGIEHLLDAVFGFFDHFGDSADWSRRPGCKRKRGSNRGFGRGIAVSNQCCPFGGVVVAGTAGEYNPVEEEI